MRIIRSGATRTVILTWRYAIKVPSLRGIGLDGRSMRGRMASFAAGLLSSQSERTWCGFYGDDVAPVLHSWLGGIVQIYPRARPVTEDDTWRFPQLDPSPGDGDKPENFGVLRRRIVWVDYDMS